MGSCAGSIAASAGWAQRRNEGTGIPSVVVVVRMYGIADIHNRQANAGRAIQST
jgi:hypothetical protein